MKFVPTVGRVLLYHPGRMEARLDFKMGEPLPVLVAAVNDDTSVNVGGFDRSGVPFGRTNINLIQEDEPRPTDGNFLEWMPYQINQMKNQSSQGGQVNTVNPSQQNPDPEALQK